MEHKDKLFKDVLAEARRLQDLPKKGYTELYKYKVARSGVIRVPNEPVSIPHIAVDMIRNHINTEKIRLEDDNIEIMVALLVNIDNFPITIKTVGTGSQDCVHVHPSNLFSWVLSKEFAAKSFILGHNHPSGNHVPSDADFSMLKHFKHLGDELERPLIDFIVLGDGTDNYYSHRNTTYDL